MKFPFVSRLAFDVLADANAALRAQHADLLARYHMLRLQGHVAPEPPSPAPPPAPERDPVQTAILEAAGGDARKYTLMLRQAARDRDAGLDDEEIIQAIHHGVEADGVPI